MNDALSAATQRTPSLVIFSRTTGYRHESIPAALAAIGHIARRAGLRPVITEDPAELATALDSAAAIVFCQVSGDVLDATQRRALLSAVTERGVGFAGIHSATDAEPSWPDYLRLVGARFDGHPDGIRHDTVTVDDPDHPSTRHLPQPWPRVEEWYTFDRPPEADLLLSRAGAPLAWHARLGAGRTWVTALGHAVDAYADPAFLAHLEGGIRSVLRAEQEPPPSA